MEKDLEEKVGLRGWPPVFFVFGVGNSLRLSCVAGNSKLCFRNFRARLFRYLICFWYRTVGRYWKPWCWRNSWTPLFLPKNWALSPCHVAIHAKVGNSTTRKLHLLGNSSSTSSTRSSNFLAIVTALVSSTALQQLHLAHFQKSRTNTVIKGSSASPRSSQNSESPWASPSCHAPANIRFVSALGWPLGKLAAVLALPSSPTSPRHFQKSASSRNRGRPRGRPQCPRLVCCEFWFWFGSGCSRSGTLWTDKLCRSWDESSLGSWRCRMSRCVT